MKVPQVVDPRGPRTVATVTAVVLAAVIVTKSPWLAAAQAVVFAIGAAGFAPYSVIFKALVRPRLGAPDDLEPFLPVRFAQAVGFVFAAAATVAFALGATTPGFVAAGFAFAAAFLNAAFGLCLGCELFLLIARAAGRPLSRRLPVH
ncbi:MAG: hypothetical protein JWM93_2716 [Frankiales bacterium]|nr:hypothetical protein [Frankiales bacterium]